MIHTTHEARMPMMAPEEPTPTDSTYSNPTKDKTSYTTEGRRNKEQESR